MYYSTTMWVTMKTPHGAEEFPFQLRYNHGAAAADAHAAAHVAAARYSASLSGNGAGFVGADALGNHILFKKGSDDRKAAAAAASLLGLEDDCITFSSKDEAGAFREKLSKEGMYVEL